MAQAALGTHYQAAHEIQYRNDFHVKIFVCEYVTGGGLYREPLPSSLAREGDLMLQSLLGDLAELPQLELLTTRDARLPLLAGPVEVVTVGQGEIWSCWQDCLARCDLLWPVAPESGGLLERMSGLAGLTGKRLLGSAPQAVALAASKHATAAALASCGVPVVPTFRSGALPAELPGAWVAKPDDGAGCEDTRCFADWQALTAWLAARPDRRRFVAQPFIAGEAASLSMLCLNGEARLLSCNRQLIELDDGAFRYHGSVLNGMAQHWAAFERMAQAVAAALPGLTGYVGVDLMLSGNELLVMEVNPRLTTSYVGLRRAIGCNPARLALDLIYNGGFQTWPDLARDVVHISLDE